MSELNEIISRENELTIRNPIGGELILNKVSINANSIEKYNEVFASEVSLLSGNITQRAVQIATQSVTLAQIAKAAPNGLFTATVDPSKLSKFKNGTFTTMVRKAGNLDKHAGFTEVVLKQSINPAMVISAGMQVMSMVSGTYYLNQVNSQISKIDNKLEELLKVHHDANIGKLIAARKGLSDIAVREMVDVADINAIRNYKKTADEINEEYVYSVHRKEDELVHSKEIQESNLDDVNFYMSVAFEASKLSLFAEVIEIGTRMKLGGQTEMIEDLTKQLEKNYSNSFYFNIENEAESFYLILQKKYESDLSSKQRVNKKIDDVSDIFPALGWGVLIKAGAKVAVTIKGNIDSSSAKKKSEIRQMKLDDVKSGAEKNRKNETIDDTIAEIIQLPYQESEIIYIPDGERQRVFVPSKTQLEK
ncbi:MAG TPA: hypothetical protein VGC17_01335 [Lactovum miscens]|uniref:hypothetical protein n=1 Tax=Lactovum miscens TaxID=190387 RepID=UPI002ED8C9C1